MAVIKYTPVEEIENISSETGKTLKAQKKVSIMIPSAKDNDVAECGINGYFFRFPCNELVEVPESLAEIIEQSRKVIREKNTLEAKYAGEGVNISGRGKSKEPKEPDKVPGNDGE